MIIQGETGSESGDLNSGSQEPPIQTLKASPFFDPLTSSDEEKIRVSVHNYTRALKRNRGMLLFQNLVNTYLVSVGNAVILRSTKLVIITFEIIVKATKSGHCVITYLDIE